ncbi:hypothetical protein [Micromonospora sp. NPDC049359]|uniref:hypothetical protein n=1 Tax=Micromonospora sp. NPDC049359 TaxID=3364270 RepID=UPI0037AF5343
MAKPTARQIAYDMLTVADSDDATPDDKVAHRHAALVYALLALGDEIRDLREAVNGVGGALTDQDHIGIGAHARYISDALEKIAKR